MSNLQLGRSITFGTCWNIFNSQQDPDENSLSFRLQRRFRGRPVAHKRATDHPHNCRLASARKSFRCSPLLRSSLAYPFSPIMFSKKQCFQKKCVLLKAVFSKKHCFPKNSVFQKTMFSQKQCFHRQKVFNNVKNIHRVISAGGALRKSTKDHYNVLTRNRRLRPTHLRFGNWVSSLKRRGWNKRIAKVCA